MSKIQTFKANEIGKDYICSDIHGHFYLLEDELAGVKFDKSRDRLFCLGDLIDRSDDSILVLDYLKEPWFYSILGNHEIMLIDVCESKNPHTKQQWCFWGGDWAEDLDDDELDVYYQAFIKLPIAIELELKLGKKVGLVHANLPDNADWDEVKLHLDKTPSNNINSYEPLLREILWEKAPLFDNYSIGLESVKNIDHVFHGHTIIEEIITLENRTYMDLGSYKYFKLGFIQPDKYLELMA